MRTRNEDGLTFAAHAEVLGRRGSVLFGKMGKPLGTPLVAMLNSQIARGATTFLYLTTRIRWNGPYVTEACKLRHVYQSFPPGMRELVPSYYLNEADRIGTWFEVVEMTRLTKEEMNRIFVISSGREIMSVIKSSATLFKVSVRPTPK